MSELSTTTSSQTYH